MRKPAVLLIVLAVVLLAVAITAEAQQAKKVHRNRVSSAGQPHQCADGKRDRFPEFVAELVRLKVDIIVVAGGNNPARTLKNATKTIPVMTGGSDPVEAGLIESLSGAATSPALRTLPEN